jgi:C4-dicarboxylate-specific signal transduction histidine kinase
VIIDDEDNYAGVRVSNRDLTELRIAEQRVREHRDMLMHQDRRANLGQLAGSIAHELTQPLTGIMSDAQAGELLLKKGNVDRIQIAEILADIVSDSKRASLVLRNLRELFGNQNYKSEPLDLNTLIEETLRVLNSEFISQGVTIYTDLPAKLPNVNGNRVQIQQILINIINNSWQAMTQVAETERWLSINTAFGDDDQVTVCLEDNGPGIDPAILESIFETLTTTKKAGLGMGLAISTSIMQAHDGRIWAENKPKGGARIIFSLPAMEVR